MYSDDVRLFFSSDEKKAFLERHGYVIKRVHVEKEVNIYQNVFQPVVTTETFAEKDGKREDIHAAFEKLLRRKILEL